MIVKDYLSFSPGSQAYISAGFFRVGGLLFPPYSEGKRNSQNTNSTQERRRRKNDQKVKPSNAYESLCSARGLQFSPLSEGIFPRFHSGMTNKTFRTEAVLFDALSG